MKFTHYIFVVVMLVVAAFSVTYMATTQKSTPTQISKEINVRGSSTVTELTPQQKADEQGERNIDWAAISAGIIAIIGAGGAVLSRVNSNKNEKFQESVNSKFEGIFILLDEFKDTQYRRSVDMELSRIGFEAIGFVKDSDLKVFMEGVVDRTRNFVRDTIQHKFDEEAYQNALSKIGARTVECKSQAKTLNFSASFEKLVNDVRNNNVRILRADLKTLSEDREFNDKYTRYQDITCKFLKSFLRDIIYAHVEHTSKNV